MKTSLELAKERLASVKNESAAATTTHSRMFLLDTSGSMSLGLKIEYAKKALTTHIKPGDGVIAFDSDIHYIPGNKVDDILTGDLTAMLPALKEAMKFKCSHIILITDGQPNVEGDTFDVTDYVLHGIRGVRIDTIGIGNDCEKEFLESLSKATNGTSYHVDNPDQLTGVVGLLTDGSSINL